MAVTPRRRLVIVEDDDDTRAFLVDLFETEGWEVRSAGNPEAAYVAVRETDPDLLLIDIMLPRESGFEVYRKIRGRAQAIFITAKPTDLPRLLARELGAVGFFRKPFDAVKLLDSARDAVLGRSAA
jgi:DNA-binding response OmpR family regulator